MLSEAPEGWSEPAPLSIYASNETRKWDEVEVLPYVGLEHIEQGTGQLLGFGESQSVTSAKNLFESGDVLFGKLRPNLRKYWKADRRGICSTDILVLKSKQGLESNYLFTVVQSEPFLSFAENDAAGTKMPRTSWKRLETIELPLPPLNEQHRIAEILSSVDASIQATQAVIEQAERVKRGLMEELLTGGLGSEAIERGEVPEGWLSLKALDIAEKAGLQTGPFGSQLKAGEYLEDCEPGAVRVVMPKDILFGSINFETAAMISGERAIPLEKHRLRMGDALFARRGDLSKVAVYGDDVVSAICGTGCLRLRPSPDLVDFRFLAFLISSESSVEWLKRNAVGVTMPNLNTEIIGAMPLVLPPLKEQIRIAKILFDANEFISAQKSFLQQQARVKQGLMDDLLTGKVRTVW